MPRLPPISKPRSTLKEAATRKKQRLRTKQHLTGDANIRAGQTSTSLNQTTKMKAQDSLRKRQKRAQDRTATMNLVEARCDPHDILNVITGASVSNKTRLKWLDPVSVQQQKECVDKFSEASQLKNFPDQDLICAVCIRATPQIHLSECSRLVDVPHLELLINTPETSASPNSARTLFRCKSGTYRLDARGLEVANNSLQVPRIEDVRIKCLCTQCWTVLYAGKIYWKMLVVVDRGLPVPGLDPLDAIERLFIAQGRLPPSQLITIVPDDKQRKKVSYWFGTWAF
jgi:hypothetical protein